MRFIYYQMFTISCLQRCGSRRKIDSLFFKSFILFFERYQYMNKGFLKALSDVKKQKEKEEKKKIIEKESKQIDDNISSDEERNLKELGVHKKKIRKDNDHKVSTWKHDRFKQEPEAKPKPTNYTQQLSLKFLNSPGYSKLFPIIKHIKIYIRQIDDSKIVFNTEQAYEQAKKLFTLNALPFSCSQSKASNK